MAMWTKIVSRLKKEMTQMTPLSMTERPDLRELACLSLRKDSIVLNKPNFILGVLVAFIGEALHCLEDRLIRLTP